MTGRIYVEDFKFSVKPRPTIYKLVYGHGPNKARSLTFAKFS